MYAFIHMNVDNYVLVPVPETRELVLKTPAENDFQPVQNVFPQPLAKSTESKTLVCFMHIAYSVSKMIECWVFGGWLDTCFGNTLHLRWKGWAAMSRGLHGDLNMTLGA